MKIGIGITTTPNRAYLMQKTLSQIQTYTDNAEIYIHDDISFKGVAYAKNMCIHNLRHCDFVFLFDDDCYPTHQGWINYCIAVFEQTSEKHFLLLDKVTHAPFVTYAPGMYCFENCGGVFMAFDNHKGLFKKVGYMDSRYTGWGFEHAGYSNRIYRMGYTSHPYIMPQFLDQYIYSLDYHQSVASSVTNEQKTINYHQNFKIFQSELNDKPKYKAFKP